MPKSEGSTTPTPDKLEIPEAGVEAYPTLREANIARQADWCPEQLPDLSFRGNELAGETGEVCNVIKKLERERFGWRGSRDTVEHLAEELADVVICADLCAISAGIDLNQAVEAKFNATSEKVGLPHRLVSLPHMPDRGYAEGIEAAAKVADAIEKKQDTDHGSANSGGAAEAAAAIRSALIAPPAPTDNGELDREESYQDAWVVWNNLAPHGYLSAGGAGEGPQGYQGSVIAIIRAALSATPSPIEDVAPSEAEIDDIAGAFIDACTDHGDLEWLALHNGRIEINGNFPKDAVFRAFAARRVRSSPVDEDARDGVLVDALRAARDQIALLGGEPVAGDLNADQIQVAVLGVIDDALQSQRKG